MNCMRQEFDWSVILAQEFTKAVKHPMPSHMDGTMVIADTPSCGIRVPGAMICDSLVEFVEQDKILVCGSVLSFVLRHPELGDLYFISAHLDATTSRSAYAQSISNLDFVISQCPNDAAICCGVDANSNIFGLDPEELPPP